MTSHSEASVWRQCVTLDYNRHEKTSLRRSTTSRIMTSSNGVTWGIIDHPLIERKSLTLSPHVSDISNCTYSAVCGLQASTRFVNRFYTGMFPVGDTSCRTLIAVCVCVRACACARTRTRTYCLNCAKND